MDGVLRSEERLIQRWKIGLIKIHKDGFEEVNSTKQDWLKMYLTL